MNDAITQLQTSLEECSNERKDYRDKMDIANAVVSRLKKENKRLKEELTKLQTSKPAK